MSYLVEQAKYSRKLFGKLCEFSSSKQNQVKHLGNEHDFLCIFFLPILIAILSHISLPVERKMTKFVLSMFRTNLLLSSHFLTFFVVPCLQSFVSVASLTTQSKY